jgi:hypothetical protein
VAGRPGKAQPHATIHDIVSIEDWLPTLMTAAGELLQGYTAVETLRRLSLDSCSHSGISRRVRGRDPSRSIKPRTIAVRAGERQSMPFVPVAGYRRDEMSQEST